MALEQKIKDWVKYDNNYRRYNEEIKKIRDVKNDLSNDIFNIIKEKNIENPSIKISDGALSFTETKIANVVSYKFLEDCFKDYFKNENESQQLIEFIKSKRSYTMSSSIKRSYNKE
jgi:hypothetical protein